MQAAVTVNIISRAWPAMDKLTYTATASVQIFRNPSEWAETSHPRRSQIISFFTLGNVVADSIHIHWLADQECNKIFHWPLLPGMSSLTAARPTAQVFPF